MPKFGHFGPKSVNFLILAKFRMYPISKVLISNLILVFGKFEAQILKFKHFGPKCINIFILNEVLSVRYFEGAAFKSGICFRKFRAQIPKFELSGLKKY